MPVKVVFQGLGPIGRAAAKHMSRKGDFEILGAIDIDRSIVGRKFYGTTVVHEEDAERIFRKTKPNILVLTTCSTIDGVAESLWSAIAHGIDVVTPCEELFYPKMNGKSDARLIHEFADENDVRIHSAGINPGLILDTHPAIVMGEKGYNSKNIFLVEIRRSDDTTGRRLPLKFKLGTWNILPDFYELDSMGLLGHVGLVMTGRYVADKLGFRRYRPKFYREPVIAREPIETPHGTIPEGHVAGIHECCIIEVYYPKGADYIQRVVIDLQMYAGAKKRNSLAVNLKEIYNFDDLVNGDIATARIIIETAKYLAGNRRHIRPGLNLDTLVIDPALLREK